MNKSSIRTIGVLFSLALSAACSGLVPTAESVTSASEEAYCTAGSITVSGTPLTITGITANYTYYATTAASGLSGSLSTRGIPYAEVVIKDSAGTTVQCSETNSSGTIANFQIPKIAGTYTVQVRSRSSNAKTKASVLKDISSNSPYAVSGTFTVTGSEGATKTVAGTITASGSSSTREGAAFHILYNIYLANEYIRTETGNASFVADKVSAYWKNGFNPGSYVGTSNPLSFYIQGSRQLYILGGSNGNSTTADTDHFDDSVIIHEYGHFLEDVYSRTDSQGGSHNGNFIIDPRLAWSEGWANFFQGAVIRSIDATRGRYYVDTVGGAVSIRFDLGASGAATSYDPVAFDGEGTFREVSVSRTLWKTTALAGAPVAPAGAEIPFSALWDVFTSSTNGLKNPLNYFRNIGMFNKYLDARITASYPTKVTAWNNILSNEKQNATTKDYADPVSISGTCAAYPRQLNPVADDFYGTSPIDRSHLLRSNDFYLFYYSGSGGTLNLNYSTSMMTGSGDNIDLDLYIYKNAYVYQEDYLEDVGQSTGGVVMKSDKLNGVMENGTESLSLTYLTPGYYLINVKANTLDKITAEVNGIATYSLQLVNGSTSYLCPQNN